MKKILPVIIILIIVIVGIKALSGESGLNVLSDSHFTASGALKKVPNFAKIDKKLVLRFYVESSGSMNGFFRSGIATSFKRDVYAIMSYYSNVTKDINVMTNEGNVAGKMSLGAFQQAMNTGSLQSNASTKIPVMLTTIIKQMKKGEVAVLVSDMKYSPVGDDAPDVLLSQYGSDIARIAGNSGKSFSLICAISDYVNSMGNIVTKRSPYYFLIIGDQDKVSFIRNGISTLLDGNKTFIDNLDFGYNYGSVPYSFGIPQNAIQLAKQPTFTGYTPNLGPCTISLKLHLEAYRWIVTNKDVLSECFTCKTLYGSKVIKTGIDVKTDNYVNQQLDRSAIVTIKLTLSDMPQDMDVIEWNLKIPNAAEKSYLAPFLGANSESDVTKTYSLENFIIGIQQGGIVNRQPAPNYILVTKNNI